MISARGPGELVASGLAAPGPRAGTLPRPDSAAGELFSERPAWKAFSLWQPYPSLIARGLKTIATMHRPTDYRGPVAIHAGRILDLASAPDDLCLSGLGVTWCETLPYSAIVAVAELVDCVPCRRLDTAGLTRAERAAGVFSDQRFAWRLATIRALRRPIPCAGRQGLFSWAAPEDLHDQLGPVLDHARLAHAVGWGLNRTFADA